MQIVDFYNIIKPIQTRPRYSLEVFFPNVSTTVWVTVVMSYDNIRKVFIDSRFKLNRRVNKILKGND